jgi:branched-subunit amino acid aminotransferase/4-amino-4-deoxychorismate lyase
MDIYIDGEWHARDTAKVSVFDHGLLYGDGVFEGIRVYNRRIFRLAAHLDRLYASAQALALAIPLTVSEMAAAELMPVAEVDGRRIADGKPGAVMRRLTEAFQALVRHEGEPLW